MSTTQCETLRNVQKGRTDWKVKVRIIREWRGITSTGIVFKGYNLLFLDNKVSTSFSISKVHLSKKLGPIKTFIVQRCNELYN